MTGINTFARIFRDRLFARSPYPLYQSTDMPSVGRPLRQAAAAREISHPASALSLLPAVSDRPNPRPAIAPAGPRGGRADAGTGRRGDERPRRRRRGPRGRVAGLFDRALQRDEQQTGLRHTGPDRPELPHGPLESGGVVVHGQTDQELRRGIAPPAARHQIERFSVRPPLVPDVPPDEEIEERQIVGADVPIAGERERRDGRVLGERRRGRRPAVADALFEDDYARVGAHGAAVQHRPDVANPPRQLLVRMVHAGRATRVHIEANCSSHVNYYPFI